MSRNVNVIVTGVGGGGHGEQILKALRLSDLSLKIFGTDMSSKSKGLAEVDKGFILPPATHQEYIKALIHLSQRMEAEVVFHGSEPELKVMSENREIFEKNKILLPINSRQVINTCMDKFLTSKFLEENGFLFPKSVEVSDIEKIKEIDFFPVVLKPSVGGGGSANTFIAQDHEELFFFSKYLLKTGSKFIVQEYVGTVEDEYTVGVLFDMDSNYLNSIAVRRNILSALSNRLKIKNNTNRQDLGSILAISSGVSQGEIGRFPNVTEPCREIATKLGARGAINIQCRLHKGKVYVFEINPRFSGTTSLRAMVGYNEPEILIKRHILSQDVQANFSYKEGSILRGLSETFVSGENVFPSWKES